jgi:hypothetical protein
MKGLILAGLAFALVVVGSVVGLHFYRGGKEFKVFLGVFAGAVALYAAAFRGLPPDLGFLPMSWQEGSPAVDFGNGLLILGLVFHGYWSFSYFTCVSPSMSLLVALQSRGRQGLSKADALAIHGSEEPVNTLFQRRLPKLLQGGYVQEEAGAYRLLPRGGRVAALGSFLKKLINAQVGA